jgi:hypothetical protein
MYQEEITIVNTYAPHISTHNFVKQTLLSIKALTDLNTVIVDAFTTSLSPILGQIFNISSI